MSKYELLMRPWVTYSAAATDAVIVWQPRLTPAAALVDGAVRTWPSTCRDFYRESCLHRQYMVFNHGQPSSSSLLVTTSHIAHFRSYIDHQVCQYNSATAHYPDDIGQSHNIWSLLYDHARFFYTQLWHPKSDRVISFIIWKLSTIPIKLPWMFKH